MYHFCNRLVNDVSFSSLTAILNKYSIEYNIDYNIDNNLHINNLTVLQHAKKNDLTFLKHVKYIKHLQNAADCICLVSSNLANKIPDNIKKIVVKDPFIAFIRIFQEVYKTIDSFDENGERYNGSQNIELSNVLGSSISICATIYNNGLPKIGQNCKITDNVIIYNEVEIGNNVSIGANCVIGSRVKIGNNTIIRPNSVIINSHIGENCYIDSGAKIGQNGFGFLPIDGKIVEIPQVACVIIGNNVSIGANTCVDRGSFQNTILNNNVKIDNQCQIGHNVCVGENTIIAGQSGIAGSVVIGKNCMLGGKTGVADNITLGDNVIAMGNAIISTNIDDNSIIAGHPAIDAAMWRRSSIKFKNLGKRSAVDRGEEQGGSED